MRISGIFAMSGDYGYDGYESFYNGYYFDGGYPRSGYYRNGYEGYIGRYPGRIYSDRDSGGLLGLFGGRH